VRYDVSVTETGRADAEAAIREAHERGDMEAAVQAGLERYRTEIFSFLCARLGAESDAHEVFSQVTEDLWRGIAGFRWQSSFRTWLYTLARHAAIRFERSPANQGSRRQGLSRAPELSARDRSRTRPYLRTEVKDRFAALRATLSPDEQSLLVLRVDRGMSWEEVARVFHDEGEADPAALRRQATNLRQRFRQLKERLRERARAEGLLDDEEG
jgi:RNA polymerase sigma-70 factor (ECF subfamily)